MALSAKARALARVTRECVRRQLMCSVTLRGVEVYDRASSARWRYIGPSPQWVCRELDEGRDPFAPRDPQLELDLARELTPEGEPTDAWRDPA